MQTWLGFTYRDWHRGLLVLLPQTIIIIVAEYFKIPLAIALWLAMGAFFMAFSITGKSKLQQSYRAFEFSLVCIAVIFLGLFCADKLSPWWFNLSLIPLIFLCLCIALMATHYAMTAPLIAMLVVLPQSLVPPGPFIFTTVLTVFLIPFVLGCLLTAAVSLCLPKVAVPEPIKPRRNFTLIRASRMSVAISLCYMICEIFHLSHASWAALSVLTVSQGTLGTTIRKAWQRLLGTALGVIVGAPLTLYVFDPYPDTKYVGVLLISIAFVVFMRFYALTMFLGTLCLGALYFILFPGAHDILPFIFSRLLETLLGIVVIISLETFVSPCSVLGILRANAQCFWRQMAFAMGTHDKIEFTERLQAAEIYLVDMKQRLDELRYEPLAFMSKRYHTSLKLINALFHYRKAVLAYDAEDELDQERRAALKSLYEKIAYQYGLSDAERINYLEAFLYDYPESEHKLFKDVKRLLGHSLQILQVKRRTLARR